MRIVTRNARVPSVGGTRPAGVPQFHDWSGTMVAEAEAEAEAVLADAAAGVPARQSPMLSVAAISDRVRWSVAVNDDSSSGGEMARCVS
jgi:hypothetical protein